MDKIPETIQELYFYIDGRFKEFDQKISNLRSMHDSCPVKNEMIEHKKNHWSWLTIIVGVTAVIVAVINIFL